MVQSIASSLLNLYRDTTATALNGGSVDVRAGATVLVTFSLGATPFTNGTGLLTLTADKNATAIAGSAATPTACDWRASGGALQFTTTASVQPTASECEWDGTISSGQDCVLAGGSTITFPSSS